MSIGRKVLALLIGAAAAGCTKLPVDGPNQHSIELGATASLTADRHAVEVDYALVDVTSNVVDHAVNIGLDSLYRTFAKRPSAAPVIRVGVGDVVQVTIFESAAGGLFIPAEA